MFKINYQIKMAALFLAVVLLFPACGPTLKRAAVSDSAVAMEREKQRELAIRDYVDKSIRLHRVAYNVFENATAFAEDNAGVDFGTGIFALCAHDLKNSRNGKMATRMFRLSEVGATVLDVRPGTDAENKFKAGDVIFTVNGNVVKSCSDLSKAINETPADRPIRYKISRGGVDRDIDVMRYKRYSCEARLIENTQINAFADGKNIYVTTGMMRFAQTDDELALVVGHELSHNILNHSGKKKANAAIGTVADVLVTAGLTILTGVPLDTGGVFKQTGALVYSKDFEFEADYMGLYLSARAGYDIQKAPDFWRRMAIESPNAIERNYSATHPSTAERYVALENTVAEITKKKENNLPLAPDKKD